MRSLFAIVDYGFGFGVLVESGGGRFMLGVLGDEVGVLVGELALETLFEWFIGVSN